MSEIKFYSKRQEERFNVFTSPKHNTETTFNKVIKQNSFGEIAIQCYHNTGGRWYGHLTILGKRGGEKTLHGWYVAGDNKENLTLIRR